MSDAVNENDTIVALNVRILPKPLRHDFKVWCTEHDLSMERVVKSLIEQVVSGNLPQPLLRNVLISSES